MTKARTTDILLRMAGCASRGRYNDEMCNDISCDDCMYNVEDVDAYDCIVQVLYEWSFDETPISCGIPGNSKTITYYRNNIPGGSWKEEC